MTSELTYSPEFYRRHAERYSQVSHELLQGTYTKSSNPTLRDDFDVISALKNLVPPNSRGLDAGCGAGARDVFLYSRDGYDMVGIDAINENIQIAKKLHPEISNRVSVCDLNLDLEFPDSHFDFILCNGVIQHIQPETVMKRVLPEFVRILKVGGILQLMFKSGDGITTVFDKDYEADRTFQLYCAEYIVHVLADLGTSIVPVEDNSLGGIMFFTDPKPMEHCLVYAKKIN